MYPRQYLYMCDNCGKSIHTVVVSKGEPPNAVSCSNRDCVGIPCFRFDGPVVRPDVSEARWELYSDGLLSEIQKALGSTLPILKLRERTEATPQYLSEEMYELYKKE